MRLISIFTVAFFGFQPLIAEEATVESLALKIKILERKVATLSLQVAASRLREGTPSTPATGAGNQIVLNVSADGSIRIEDKIVSDTEVTRRLEAVAAEFENQPLRIRAEKETKFQDIVRVIDLCQRAGIWDISFATVKTPDEQGADGDGEEAVR